MRSLVFTLLITGLANVAVADCSADCSAWNKLLIDRPKSVDGETANRTQMLEARAATRTYVCQLEWVLDNCRLANSKYRRIFPSLKFQKIVDSIEKAAGCYNRELRKYREQVDEYSTG